MKNIFKKVFSRPVLEPITIFVVSMLVLEFIVFPGLTVDNTLLNIGAGAVGIFLTLLVLAYADGKIREKYEKKEDNDWGGLTNEELIGDDEIPKEKLKEKEDGKI
jgi:hypothetical protein